MTQDIETQDEVRSPLDNLDFAAKLFVEEYMVDCDPKEAAVRAGHGVQGARKAANKFLAREDVKIAIEWAMRDRLERLHLSQDRVVEEYARIAFSNIADYVDWNAGSITVRGRSQIAPSKQAAVQQVTESTTPQGTTITIKLYDKMKALDALAKYFGMFNEKVTVEDQNLGSLITMARQRVLEGQALDKEMGRDKVSQARLLVTEGEEDDPDDAHTASGREIGESAERGDPAPGGRDDG